MGGKQDKGKKGCGVFVRCFPFPLQAMFDIICLISNDGFMV